MKNIIIITLLFLLITANASSQTDSVGIYIQNRSEIKRIEPLHNSGIKTSTIGSALSMGLSGADIRTFFNGSVSINNVYLDSRIYFYLPKTTSNAIISQKYYSFFEAETPQNFVLCKFYKKRNRRELKVGHVNIYTGTNMGTLYENTAPFKWNKIRENVFEITLNSELEPGEYCFIYNNGASNGYLPVFDFSAK